MTLQDRVNNVIDQLLDEARVVTSTMGSNQWSTQPTVPVKRVISLLTEAIEQDRAERSIEEASDIDPDLPVGDQITEMAERLDKALANQERSQRVDTLTELIEKAQRAIQQQPYITSSPPYAPQPMQYYPPNPNPLSAGSISWDTNTNTVTLYDGNTARNIQGYDTAKVIYDEASQFDEWPVKKHVQARLDGLHAKPASKSRRQYK